MQALANTFNKCVAVTVPGVIRQMQVVHTRDRREYSKSRSHCESHSPTLRRLLGGFGCLLWVILFTKPHLDSLYLAF